MRKAHLYFNNQENSKGSLFYYKIGGEVALKLNARQKSFCEYYVVSGNATEAAIKAGYKEKNARFIGSENLTKANIKE